MASHGPPSQEQNAAQDEGPPPYRPQYQALGETPSIIPDLPINAIFLALFIGAAVGHMTIFKKNMRRGKKFILNGMIFGFCMTRIFATTLRIVWSTMPDNVSVGIAAMIFVYAGIILLFFANLFFAQRIVRAQHPHFGWSKPFSVLVPVLIAICIGMILCLIAAVIVEFFTLGAFDQNAASDIQRVGTTLFALVAFLPLPIVIISTVIRRIPRVRNTKTVDKFGQGSMRSKIAIVLVSGFFLSLGATYRASTELLPHVPILTDGTPPHPVPHPYYFSKAAFYAFNFSIEICIVYFWIIVRIDKRFYVPDGSKGPFSYAGGFVFAGEAGNEKRHTAGPRDSQRYLMNQSTTSLHSRAGSRRSIESRISWGGISREAIPLAFGEDGMHPMPYAAFEEAHFPEVRNDDESVFGIELPEKEMGWDPKTGKWALRPTSVGNRSRSSTIENQQQPPLPEGLFPLPDRGASASPDTQRSSNSDVRQSISPDVRRPTTPATRTSTISSAGHRSTPDMRRSAVSSLRENGTPDRRP